MMTVRQVSRLTGVSVRTLHHYDAIGLLKPSCVTEAGYRLYDEAALARLHSILLFRELEFPLREIGRILDTPGFDRTAALREQIHMLELRRRHIDGLIDSAREMLETGGTNMGFGAFDRSEMDHYAAEAKERWGGTEAYRQSERRTAGKSTEELAGFGAEMMEIFARFGKLRGTDPAGEAAQHLAAELQQFITDHFYTCTRQILGGLGQMYVADDRFRANIDASGGEGTAEFAAEAIAIYAQ